VQPRNVYSGNAANRWPLCGKAEGRVINKEPKARIALVDNVTSEIIAEGEK
jgi:hypothetical protein